MEKLIIGIDLSDTCTQAAVAGREETVTLPTAICRKKNIEEWCVGEDAYRYTLVGEGVMVDKLLSLASRDGTSTISEVKYEGKTLLLLFLKRVLQLALGGGARAEAAAAGTAAAFGVYDEAHKKAPAATAAPAAAPSGKRTAGEACGGAQAEIGELVISLKNLEMKLMDLLMEFADELGVSRNHLHIISHTESFVYYVLNQRRDVWGGQVGMFALSDGDLRYYELKVVRGARQMTAYADHEELEEGFNLSVLDTASGARMADKILCACADRFLQKRLFSSIFLTGKGFAKTDWAPEFMKQLCTKRRVFAESALFAKGAAMRAEEYLRERQPYPFVCLCEGKLRSTVSMEVIRHGGRAQIALASAGESWYEARNVLEVILDGQNVIDLTITPQQDPKQKRTVQIPLEGFPERPDRTTRVRIAVGFLDEKTMVVKAVDRGFGELFAKTDAEVRQEVMV